MSYFLPEGYIERPDAPQSFDVGGGDTWQDEVYSTARQLADVLGLHTVVDIGCGSGFKLIKYFGEKPFTTVGVDLEPAIDSLKLKYPGYSWVTPGGLKGLSPSLLICSDVIEHVYDPDNFCEHIRTINPKWIVISTPDRKLMAKFPKWTARMGPPGNGCHVREWTFGEFRLYMDSHFDVVRHFHSNVEQCTQCAIMRLKRS